MAEVGAIASSAVEALGLRRTLRGRPVVNGVSLTLRSGGVTGFLGANGAGKTTTIRLMLGLISGSGETQFLGRSLREWKAPASVVGVVLGGVAGHPKHTVRAHLRMVAAGAGVPDSRVDEMLGQVGLAGACVYGRRDAA
ncbi:ATP-binding cassette domain-containing protein [Streptomyces hypolithicus]